MELPPLPYAPDALEPFMSAEQLRIHHGKHHAAYVKNYTAAVDGTALADKDVLDVILALDEVPADRRTAVRNHGGGVANHSFFWESMAPPGTGGEPSGELLAALNDSFGSLDAFKDAFSTAARTLFGSGWAWLCLADGKLVVTTTPNQDRPENLGAGRPLLCLDVWEHAYYLQWQQRRPDYIAAWWNIVNWRRVAERFAALRPRNL